MYLEAQEFEKAASLREKEKVLRHREEEMKREWRRTRARAPSRWARWTSSSSSPAGPASRCPSWRRRNRPSSPAWKTRCTGGSSARTTPWLRCPRHPPVAGRPQGRQAARRVVRVPRSHRRGQDRAGARARRVPLRRRERADPHRHVRVHGEVLGVPAARRPPGYVGYEEAAS